MGRKGGESRSVHEEVDDGIDIEFLEVSVLLADTDKEDGDAGGVDHGEGGTDFLIDSVELGEHDSIDETRLLIDRSVLVEGGVEFGQLVYSIVSHEGLSHKEHQIRLVHVHQLGQ